MAWVSKEIGSVRYKAMIDPDHNSPRRPGFVARQSDEKQPWNVRGLLSKESLPPVTPQNVPQTRTPLDIDLSPCSSACAHFSALSPLGIPPQGTDINQITYEQLERLNIVPLLILAAEIDGAALNSLQVSSNFLDLQWFSFQQADGSWKLQNSHKQTHEPYVQEYNWTRVEFECLGQALYYREACNYESAEPAVIWGFDNVCSIDSPRRELAQIQICESAFVHGLLDPENTSTTTMQSQLNPLFRRRNFRRRRNSMPKLQDPDTAVISPGDIHTTSCTMRIDPYLSGPLKMPQQAAEKVFSQQARHGIKAELANPSMSNRIASMVRSELATRTSASGSDIVQSVSGVVGAVASVVGSVATIALWKKKCQRARTNQSRNDEIELQVLNPTNDEEQEPTTTFGDGPDEPDDAALSASHNTARSSMAISEEDQSGLAQAHGGGRDYVDSRNGSLRRYLFDEDYREHTISPRALLALESSWSEWFINQTFKYARIEDREMSYTEAGSELYQKLCGLWMRPQVTGDYDNIQRERDQLREELLRKSNDLTVLQNKSIDTPAFYKRWFQLVLQDLTTTSQAKDLSKQREDFDLVVDEAVERQIRPLREQLQVEEKRQEQHSRVQSAKEETLLQTSIRVERDMTRLQLQQHVLQKDESRLKQLSEDYDVKHAQFQRDVLELKAIVQEQGDRNRKRMDELNKLSQNLAKREKLIQKKEEESNARMLQRSLELRRREHELNDRERRK